MTMSADSSGSHRLLIVDGLRAIAVIAVVLFHVFPTSVAGGFIGVDVFFVISGFVIAHRYIPVMVRGDIRAGDFFLRRIQRLAPAYLALVLAVTVVAFLMLTPKDLRNFGESLTAQAFYVQNLVFWSQGDYFDRAQLKPLLHTWSLAVEEQYYLFFPLLILAFRKHRKLGIALLATAFAVSLLLGLASAGSSPKTAFYLLPMRVWEFIAGMGVALIHGRVRVGRLADPLFALSIASILAACILFNEENIFPDLQAFLAVGGAALICLIEREVSPLAGLPLTNRAAQHFGRISYSWYLWHWPVVVFFFVGLGRMPNLVEGLGLLLLGYGLAVVSWRFVELRGLATPALRRPKGALTLLGVAMLFSVGAGVFLSASQGALFRFPPEQRVLFAAEMDRVTRRCSIISQAQLHDSELCRLVPGQGAPILLMGDSHANRAKPTLVALAKENGVPLMLMKRNCRAIDFGTKRNCPLTVWRNVERDLARFGIRTVIVVGFWKPEVTEAEYRAGVKRLVDAGLTVYLQKVAPNAAWFDPARRAEGLTFPAYTMAKYDNDYAVQNRVFAALDAEYGDRVTVMDPTPRLCGDTCAFETGGLPNYSDYNHLSSVGMARIAPIYAPIFD